MVTRRWNGKSRAESGGQERGVGDRGGEGRDVCFQEYCRCVWGGSARSEEARGAGPAGRVKRRRGGWEKGWERPERGCGMASGMLGSNVFEAER